MPPNKPDLSQCSVLHIKDFYSRGHPPKNKYILVIGQSSESEVLAFLISASSATCNAKATKTKLSGCQLTLLLSFPLKASFSASNWSVYRSTACATDSSGEGSPTKASSRFATPTRSGRWSKNPGSLQQLEIDLALKILPPEKSN